MEGPAKERLTGALILVAALVIIVPEMLSGPHAVHDNRVATPAQSADAGPPLRTYNLELDSAAVSVPPAKPAPAPEPERKPEPAAEAVAGVAAEAPVAEARDPVVAQVAPPVAKSPPPVIETAKPPVTRSGNWWAQLGSFSSRDNAERLAKQLRSAGFGVDVSQVKAGGKELFRVRAGPVADRAAADALRARLATLGHKAALVAP